MFFVDFFSNFPATLEDKICFQDNFTKYWQKDQRCDVNLLLSSLGNLWNLTK